MPGSKRVQSTTSVGAAICWLFIPEQKVGDEMPRYEICGIK
jgi:hypothetical protein